MPVKRRNRVIAVAIGCVIAAGGVFGYVEIFTKGLDRLPAKPCSGAVERSTAASALPAARKAEERGKLTTSNRNFTFWCYVRTSDSTISGEAETVDAAVSTWSNAYANKRDGNTVNLASGDIRAISLPGLTSVYVPCTPPRRKTSEAVESYSLTVEVRTIGETRVHGTELRQVVTDFAYQLAKHAYKVGKCQEPRKFPRELPRITSN